jgi:hypothetical protein
MGRVIRNQRKGRGSIFSEFDRNNLSSPSNPFAHTFFVRLCTQDSQENWKRQDTPQDTGIGILIWNFFFTYSGQHPPEQDPRPVPYPRLR